MAEATGLRSNGAEYPSSSVDGWGTHYYAQGLRDDQRCRCAWLLLPTRRDRSPPGGSLSAWADMDVNFTTSLSTATADQSPPATSCVSSKGTSYACLDLAGIPAAYAGRTRSAGRYDPGDGDQGDIDSSIGIVPPAGSGATSTSPCWVTTSTSDGDSVVHARCSTPTT